MRALEKGLGWGATVIALLVAAPAAALQSELPERERSAVVYGDEACPEPETPEEVVVCARRPEEERYRIPAPLRRDGQPAEASWSAQAAALEEAQRDTRPDSCSVVGSHGHTGCTREMLRRWLAERRARRRER
jgi:hypothetical protein